MFKSIKSTNIHAFTKVLKFRLFSCLESLLWWSINKIIQSDKFYTELHGVLW